MVGTRLIDRRFWSGLAVALGVLVAANAPTLAHATDSRPSGFTIAVIPDTQNYVDYKQQKVAGFAVDSSAMFLEQMRYVADHAKSAGGDIIFAIGLGDMWQHYSVDMDLDHKARGFKRAPNPSWPPAAATRSFEIPTVVRGYRMFEGVLPFSAVPGNHDYDSTWVDAAHPPQPGGRGSAAEGMTHFTGLDNFCTVFSDRSSFFKDKPWYVGSHDCGADSAQIFEAGGYSFLQIGLQYHPSDASLAWAQTIIDKYPGLPTILSTHDYLHPDGRPGREVFEDPERNAPVELWDKFVRRNDQIFLVLSGHRCAQAYRLDRNDLGHAVQQILTDYQCRGQALKDAGMSDIGIGLGDGWLRLLRFDLGDEPHIHVRTYSTHYKAFSTDLPSYAGWYKQRERPTYTDEEFLAEDDFPIPLTDFRARFGDPKNAAAAPARSRHPRVSGFVQSSVFDR